MRKVILILSTIFFSCSSGNNNIVEPQEEQFVVELVATSTNVNIDEVTTFEIKTNNPAAARILSCGKVAKVLR
ncbi:hypothetical protein [Polaribacter sp. HL-MS24]|uniref:hypothetical protein n=1 Tax=Polaribacter sp. HL-MS24 TaxID=3077735 RepID=UPI00293418A2|nr:hypothetical protein [Polaribacter sp. HL-MS24]WOC39724.1 hypothetical protein RRF69_08680 [Polaribacter sp. HL-MS24]